MGTGERLNTVSNVDYNARFGQGCGAAQCIMRAHAQMKAQGELRRDLLVQGVLSGVVMRCTRKKKQRGATTGTGTGSATAATVALRLALVSSVPFCGCEVSWGKCMSGTPTVVWVASENVHTSNMRCGARPP